MRKKGIAALLLAAALFAVWFFRPDAAPDPKPEARQTVTENGTRVDYYNSEGILTVHPALGYASYRKTTDSRGHTVLEEYLDAKGRPARLSAGYCAIARTYDELGRCDSISYLGEKGQLVTSDYGYAKILRSFNDAGYIDCQRYFSPEGAPARDWAGAYGFRRSYDAQGRVVRLVYLGKDGQPGNCFSGYAEERYTYDEKWLRETETYYDAEGKAAASNIGAWGIRYTYDSQNRVSQITYLDAQGKPADLPRGYAWEVNTYNADGQLAGTAYYTADGSKAMAQGRYHGFTVENGRQRFYNTQGKTVILPDRYLREHMVLVGILAVVLCLAIFVLPKSACNGLIVLYLLFIVYMTLMNRPGDAHREVQPLLFSYRKFFYEPSTRKHILANIALFVPFGALLRRVSRQKWSWVWFVALTAAIEAIQYFTGLGSCEADDILNNILGGFLGWWLIYFSTFRSGKAR